MVGVILKFMNYRDIAYDIIEDCKTEFKDKFILNLQPYEKLFKLCKLAEILSEEFSAEDVEIKASSVEINGEVIIYVDELILYDGRRHDFFDYIKEAADFLSFSKSRDGLLKVSFGVYDLWAVVT